MTPTEALLARIRTCIVDHEMSVIVMPRALYSHAPSARFGVPLGDTVATVEEWIPERVELGDNFFGVHRYVDRCRLAGELVNATGLHIDEAVNVARAAWGGHPDLLLLSEFCDHAVGSVATHVVRVDGPASFLLQTDTWQLHVNEKTGGKALVCLAPAFNTRIVAREWGWRGAA